MDIIIDRVIEDCLKDSDDIIITPHGFDDGSRDGEIANISISSCSTNDEYILDACLLCSCTGKARDVFNSNDQTDTDKERLIGLRTTYDRHGGVQRTSSRRVMQKYFKRCPYCAGRVLVLDEQEHRGRIESDEALFSVDDTIHPSPHGLVDSGCEPDHVTLQQQQEYDNGVDITVLKQCEGEHGLEKKEESADENGEVKEVLNTDRNKLRLTLSPPITIVKSPTPPLPAHDGDDSGDGQDRQNSYVASPGFVNSYKDSLHSPNSGVTTFYQAGSLLHQSRYEISTRTSQLVQNTPSRLHTFFTHVMRKRKHNNNNSESRRGSKINLHRIFHFSTSPKTSARCHSQQTRGEGEEHVATAVESPSVSERRGSGARRRFNFSKTLKISRQEYVDRRKSTPVQFYRRRASSSAPETPEEKEIDQLDPHVNNELASNSHNSLPRPSKSANKRGLRSQLAAAKSHDALSTIDQSDGSSRKKNQLASKSHSSLSKAGQSGRKHNLKYQSETAKSHSALSSIDQSDGQNESSSQSLNVNGKQMKRSRSLIDFLLLRKKTSNN